MDNVQLASELLTELKASAKRWFIAFCIMCVLEVATVIGFMWHISLPIDTSEVTVDNQSGNANYIGNDLNGVIQNGEDNSEENTQSGEK